MINLIKEFSIFIYTELLCLLYQISRPVSALITIALTIVALPLLFVIRVIGLVIKYFGIAGLIALYIYL